MLQYSGNYETYVMSFFTVEKSWNIFWDIKEELLCMTAAQLEIQTAISSINKICIKYEEQWPASRWGDNLWTAAQSVVSTVSISSNLITFPSSNGCFRAACCLPKLHSNLEHEDIILYTSSPSSLLALRSLFHFLLMLVYPLKSDKLQLFCIHSSARPL